MEAVEDYAEKRMTEILPYTNTNIAVIEYKPNPRPIMINVS